MLGCDVVSFVSLLPGGYPGARKVEDYSKAEKWAFGFGILVLFIDAEAWGFDGVARLR